MLLLAFSTKHYTQPHRAAACESKVSFYYLNLWKCWSEGNRAVHRHSQTLLPHHLPHLVISLLVYIKEQLILLPTVDQETRSHLPLPDRVDVFSMELYVLTVVFYFTTQQLQQFYCINCCFFKCSSHDDKFLVTIMVIVKMQQMSQSVSLWRHGPVVGVGRGAKQYGSVWLSPAMRQ